MPLTGFVSDAVVMGDIASLLKVAGPSALPAYYVNIVSMVHQDATALIYEKLEARGYTPAQIAGWDRGAGVERKLAVVDALQLAGAAESIPEAWLKAYDGYAGKDGLLETVLLTAGGAWAAPQDTPGTAQSGGPAFEPSAFPIRPPRPLGCDGEGLRW